MKNVRVNSLILSLLSRILSR